MDEAAETNRKHWERMVAEGCGFTEPWLDLNPDRIRRYREGSLDPPPEPLIQIYPPAVLADLRGKDVLCLASGGGQQSAVFGLLGARVTVLDLVEGQLEGDRRAAAHYGYEVAVFEGDMRDLSAFSAGAFDLVYQAPSLSYVPDVRPVFAEAYRVLRPGGTYRPEFSNPATQFVDVEHWDGEGYRITVPYRVRRIERDAADFRHYLSDCFNGLIETGFTIHGVYESPHNFRETEDPEPGTWEHWLSFVQTLFAIVAGKPAI